MVKLPEKTTLFKKRTLILMIILFSIWAQRLKLHELAEINPRKLFKDTTLSFVSFYF